MGLLDAAMGHHHQSQSQSGHQVPLIMPYPNPHVPPFPSPTLVHPLSQLRQPYLVTLTNQTIETATNAVGAVGGGRKRSLSASTSGGEADVPIRLSCTFAPSRAWLVGSQHNMFNRRQQQRSHDALYVMASHGVLLEYSLDAVPEPSKK